MRRFAVLSALAALALVAAMLALLRGSPPGAAQAASHREAPAISQDPTADITDFFMFRSYQPGKEKKVVLIMNVIPGEEPSSGPNYWNFSPGVRYLFNVDNNKDGVTDIQFKVRFGNEFRGISKDAKLFLPYVALPPITSLSGDGSQGLGFHQLAGFNVHEIALELPASMLTKDHMGPLATAFPKLGAYASTERRRVRQQANGTWVVELKQVQRLANPLINEAVIGTVDKDK